MTEFYRTVYLASPDVDLDDPEAAAQLQEQFTEQAEDLDEVSNKVNDYLSENCDVGASD